MAKTYEVTQLLYCKDLGSYIDAPAIVPSSEIRYVGNEYMGPQFENPIMTRLELSGGKYMLVRNSPTEFNDLGNPVVFSSEDDGKSIVINFAEKIVQPDGYYHISGVGYLHRIWPKWIDLIIGLLEGHKIPYTFLLSSKSEVGMSGQTLSLVFGECFTRTEVSIGNGSTLQTYSVAQHLQYIYYGILAFTLGFNIFDIESLLIDGQKAVLLGSSNMLVPDIEHSYSPVECTRIEDVNVDCIKIVKNSSTRRVSSAIGYFDNVHRHLESADIDILSDGVLYMCKEIGISMYVVYDVYRK